MAKNTSPIFTIDAILGMVSIATANTNRDGSGTIGTLVTGVAGDTRISRITIKATGTTTAGMVRLWMHDGANYKLWREILVSAITASATVATFESILEFLGERAIVLPAGHSIRASTENAENFDLVAEGGNNQAA